MRTPLQTSVFALLALLPTARVVAQATPAPAAAPAAAAAPAPAAPPPAVTITAKPEDAAAQGAATKGKDAAGRDALSVDFPDMDIREILRNVADLFELNIIIPESLQGKTTIKLRDVTWRQIFTSVLEPVGYTFVEEGNIIKIITKESVDMEPVVTEIFLINYAKASDIAPIVTSLIDPAKGGKIVIDARTNSLVITERPTRITKMKPIIEQLDRATDQVMIESKFVEVFDSDVKNIGVNWSSLAAYQLHVGNITNTVDRSRGQTSSSGFDRNDTTRLNTINGINNSNIVNDTSGTASGSNTGVTITSTNGTPTSTSTTGSTGNITANSTTTIINGTTGNSTNTVDNALSLLGSLTNTGETNRLLSAVFSASDFNVVLSALQQVQRSKIVNNPTIVTLNNTPASINIGQERPIPSYTYNQQTGAYAISGFTYKPIGVILKVTPQVNARGDVKLTVEPEVSQSTRDVDFQGASIPVVETRKASTTVSLKDGYTMGIGGLLTSTNRNGASKVPVLGNLPVLGRLFRSDNKNEETTNLIIFITAKTMSANGAPLEQVFESGRLRNLELTPKDLPGYRDGSSPFTSGESSPPPAGTPGARK